jgi:hypothetical protein
MVGRGFIVWGAGIVGVLGLFLIFMAAGWPGGPDGCTNVDSAGHLLPGVMKGASNTCYCESYNIKDVLQHASGVRQHGNTWFNLYAIITSLIVCSVLTYDRAQGTSTNPMRSLDVASDVYVFAVLFLGLGSMWFHASLSSAVSWVDGFSMYVFVSFLVWYTVYRLWPDIPFWILCITYPATVVTWTVLGQVIPGSFTSAILIGILVLVYLALEWGVWAGARGNWKKTPAFALVLWWLAAALMITAAIVWGLAQTGGPLCHTAQEEATIWQLHAVVWHFFAGIVATLLFFYWRFDDDVQAAG